MQTVMGYVAGLHPRWLEIVAHLVVLGVMKNIGQNLHPNGQDVVGIKYCGKE
jgi:hypothetical protein